MRYRYLGFIFSFFLGSTAFTAPLKVTTAAPSVVLFNPETGRFLYEKNSHAMRHPASIAKIATLLYLLEEVKPDLNAKIQITAPVVATLPASVKQAAILKHPSYILEHDGTLMGLKKGDIVDVKALLYGMILKSGNDAANALALHFAGSIDKFVEGVNGYLRKLGFTETKMTNPHGLYHPEMLTNAHEMARLTGLALKNPLFAEIVKTKQYEKMRNHNALLKGGRHYYPQALGVKTGYHARAGFNIVAAAEDQGRKLIAVVMGAETTDARFKEAINLFETAFKEKKVVRTLFSKDSEVFTLKVKKAKNELKAHFLNDLTLEYFPSEEPELKAQLFWHKLSFPIKEGQLTGEVKVFDEKGQLVASQGLYAMHEVDQTLLSKLFSVMGSVWVAILALFGVTIWWLIIWKKGRELSV